MTLASCLMAALIRSDTRAANDLSLLRLEPGSHCLLHTLTDQELRVITLPDFPHSWVWLMQMRSILIECNSDEGRRELLAAVCPSWHCWLTLTPHFFLPGLCSWGGSLGSLESLLPVPKRRVLVRHVEGTLLAFSLPCAQGHKHGAKVSPGSLEVHFSPDTNIVSSTSLFQLLGQRLGFQVIPEGSFPPSQLGGFQQRLFNPLLLDDLGEACDRA